MHLAPAQARMLIRTLHRLRHALWFSPGHTDPASATKALDRRMAYKRTLYLDACMGVGMTGASVVGLIFVAGGLWLVFRAFRRRAKRLALRRNAVRVKGKVVR